MQPLAENNFLYSVIYNAIIRLLLGSHGDKRGRVLYLCICRATLLNNLMNAWEKGRLAAKVR